MIQVILCYKYDFCTYPQQSMSSVLIADKRLFFIFCLQCIFRHWIQQSITAKDNFSIDAHCPSPSLESMTSVLMRACKVRVFCTFHFPASKYLLTLWKVWLSARTEYELSVFSIFRLQSIFWHRVLLSSQQLMFWHYKLVITIRTRPSSSSSWVSLSSSSSASASSSPSSSSSTAAAAVAVLRF